MKTTIVIDSRTGAKVTVPNEAQINNGRGAAYYLQKRHPVSGRRLFYSPEEWASLSGDARKEAGTHTKPDVSHSALVEADKLVENYVNANPATRQAFIDRLKADLGIGSAPAPAPEKKGGR